MAYGENRRKPSTSICHYFNSPQGCNRSNCKFRHENYPQNSTQPRNSARPHTSAERTDTPFRLGNPIKKSTLQKFQRWKDICEMDVDLPIPNMPTMALELVELWPAVLDEVVKTFASEGGMRYVIVACENTSKKDDFNQHMSLFRVIAHRDVLISELLRSRRDHICETIYGLDGELFTGLFEFIIEQLKLAEALVIEDLVCALQVFHDTCLLVKTAIIPPKVKILGLELAGLAQTNITVTTGSAYHRVKQNLNKIDKMLDLRLVLDTGSDAAIALTKSVAGESNNPTALDHPSMGHDNDKLDICSISILPTLDEIMSDDLAVLPTVDPASWNPPYSVEGMIDRQFRLLREDTVGPLRDAIRTQIDIMRKSTFISRSENAALTHVYQDAKVHHISVDASSAGLSFGVSFAQPKCLRLRRSTLAERERFWAQNKRLEDGNLVCIVDSSEKSGFVLFCTIPTRHSVNRPSDKTKVEDKPTQGDRIRLSEKMDRAFITLTLVSNKSVDTDRVLHMLAQSSNPKPSQRNIVLVDFPGVLLPSFEPILKSLQNIKANDTLPFKPLLGPTEADNDGEVANVAPPSYARAPGFDFDLSCITRNNVDLKFTPTRPFHSDVLNQMSSLDQTQSKAVIHALSSSLALIQGPPGTGKSYTGIKLNQILLANQEEANLGPILVICYTNHALDQHLEHLCDGNLGVGQLIRIGRGSKSERLEDFNLKKLVKGNNMLTKSDRSEIKENMDRLIRPSSKLISAAHEWKPISEHLKEHHPQHYRVLERFSKAGSQNTVERMTNPLIDWLEGGDRPMHSPTRPLDVLLQIPIHTLNNSERSVLYAHWVNEIQFPAIEIAQGAVLKHQVVSKSLRKTKQTAELHCLINAQVIGVTSSGLAKNIDLLSRLPSKVIIFEECGEILESHTLVSMLPSVEHVILIGDHAQLRPQINRHDLSRESSHGIQYSLDMSLFERLVQPINGTRALNIPRITLQTQRRMHPSISRLIRAPLYPQLQDHSSVSNYPPVIGMRKRLFWLDHDYPETSKGAFHDDTSYWNRHEVETVVGLTGHLIKQGYSTATKLVVVTPYKTQLYKLKQELASQYAVVISDQDEDDLDLLGFVSGTPKKLNKDAIKQANSHSIRLTTIDSFQGEEADVVIVSLVRSNPKQNPGFVKTSNRINVLLSRAKHGMYIIGNATTFQKVPMWAHTIQLLKKSDCFGKTLELSCPRHPEASIFVGKAEDISLQSPEGGCKLKCKEALSCGHDCTGHCHSDLIHSAVYCSKACERKQPCNHPCPRNCGDKCPKRCEIPIYMPSGHMLPCGHPQNVLPCWQAQDLSTYNCKEKVQKTVPGCYHSVLVECGIDIEGRKYICEEICGMRRETCGHACQDACNKCVKRVQYLDDEPVEYIIDHGSCTATCDKGLQTCSHACQEICHPSTECGTCKAPCLNRCEHKKCLQPCGEPCAPCAEDTCASQCPHSRCLSPCAAPCTHLPCSKRCDKALDCGHQCPSLCGEVCPSPRYCQICGDESIKKAGPDLRLGHDLLSFKPYESLDLNKDPIIVPSCGHFLSTSNLDKIMSMDDYYTRSENGELFGIKSASTPFSTDGMKNCPTCQAPLIEIRRYGRILRRAILDQRIKKLVTWVNLALRPIYDHLQHEQNDLGYRQETEKSTPPEDMQPTLTILDGLDPNLEHVRLSGIVGDQIDGFKRMQPVRYQSLLQLHENLLDIFVKVSSIESAFRRLQMLCVGPRDTFKFGFDDSNSIVQPQLAITVEVLKIRCEIILVSDFIHLNTRSGPANHIIPINFKDNVEQCKLLVHEARSAAKPKEEIYGNMYAALYAYFWALNPTSKYDLKRNRLDVARIFVRRAEELVAKNRGLAIGLTGEVNAIKDAIGGNPFCYVDTSKEMCHVGEAMVDQSIGTGQWRQCVNGHPFRVADGESRREKFRCPECGSGRVCAETPSVWSV